MNENMQAFLNPQSVAVIGASDNPNKVGGRPIHYMKKFGFRGAIYPINPVRTEIQGIKAFPNLGAIDAVPDAVIVALGGDQVLDTVRECAEKGVRAGVIMSSGFAELGEEGRAREQELVKVARAGGMRLVGPNSQGPSNFSNGAVLNFSTMFMETDAQDGPIAIVSQSGIASVIPYHFLRTSGYGVRYVVATGNDADVGACEMVEAVAADPDIKLILVYLETISNPQALASAAAIARARGAYMVALKSGGSALGANAASSHTGAIVGNDAAIDAFLARNGIWRARDLNDLVRATRLYLNNRGAGSGRLVAMSGSGAVAVMTADLAEREDMKLASLSAQTKADLATVLPDYGTPNNPLDTTTAILTDGTMWRRALQALGSDPQADCVMVSMSVAGPGYDVDALAADTAAFATISNKPVVMSGPQARVREIFESHGLPVFSTESDAVGALSQYVRHQQMLNEVSVPGMVEGREFALPAGIFDEFRSLQALSEFGIPVVNQRICNTIAEAQEAYEAFGSVPVVVKGCAASIPHKSEHGLVKLGLKSADEVGAAAADCFSRLAGLGVDGPQVVVAQMVNAIHELALGVTVDPKLGPLVMIGEGGTLIELRRDAVSLLAPFTAEDVKRACQRLRIAPLFSGFRDLPAIDIDAFADAAVALGNFAMRCTNLKSVDINPVLALPKGRGVLAVDAVIETDIGRGE